MSGSRKISNYWLCQIVGWGTVGLSFLFYANFIKKDIDLGYLLKVLFVMVGGLFSTHLLRLYMKRNNWLLRPIEKIILRLAIAVIITTVFYSLLIMLLDQAAGFDENRRNLPFTTRLFVNILNLGILIVPWVLFYYFYHYLVKSRRQQLDTLKLEALV